MKKNGLLLAIFAFVLLLTSCSQEDSLDLTSNPGTISFSIGTPVDKISRAGTPPTVAGYKTRYIVELWKPASDSPTTYDKRMEQFSSSFTLTIDKTITNIADYRIAVWVDYVKSAENDPKKDCYYLTNNNNKGLTDVYMLGSDGTSYVNTATRDYTNVDFGSRDAFATMVSFGTMQSSGNKITARRPLARIELYASDAEVWKEELKIEQPNITFSINSNANSKYNVFDSSVDNTTFNIIYSNIISYDDYINAANNYFDKTNPAPVVTAFYFVPSGGNTDRRMVVKATYSSPTKTPTNYIFDDKTSWLDFKPNYITKVTGALLFNVNNFSIEVDEDYTGTGLTGSF